MTRIILCGHENEKVVHVMWSVLLTRIVGKSLWLSSGPYQERLLKTFNKIEKAFFVLGGEL